MSDEASSNEIERVSIERHGVDDNLNEMFMTPQKNANKENNNNNNQNGETLSNSTNQEHSLSSSTFDPFVDNTGVKTQKSEMEILKEKIMKLEQRNFELERKLSSNQNPNANTSSKDNSFNDSFTFNPNDDSITSSTKTDCSIMKAASIGSTNQILANGSLLLTTTNNNTSNSITNVLTNTRSPQPAPAIPLPSSVLNQAHTNNISNNSKFQNPLNAIPNINQGGFIITSNGSIAYVPPTPSHLPQRVSNNMPEAIASTSSLASSSSLTNDLASSNNNNLSPNSSKQTNKNEVIFDEQIKIDFDSLSNSIQNKNSNNTHNLDLNSFIAKNLLNSFNSNNNNNNNNLTNQTSPKISSPNLAKLNTTSITAPQSTFIISANGQIVPVIPTNNQTMASLSPNQSTTLNTSINNQPLILPIPILPKQTIIKPKPITTTTTTTSSTTLLPSKITKKNGTTNKEPKVKKVPKSKAKTNSNTTKMDLNSLLVSVAASSLSSKTETPLTLIAAKPSTNTTQPTVPASNATATTTSTTTTNIPPISTTSTTSQGKKPREIRPKPSSSSNLLNLAPAPSPSSNLLIKPAVSSSSSSQNTSKLSFSIAPAHQTLKLSDLNSNMGTLNLITSNNNNNNTSFSIESNDILAKAASMIFSPNEFNQLNNLSPNTTTNVNANVTNNLLSHVINSISPNNSINGELTLGNNTGTNTSSNQFNDLLTALSNSGNNLLCTINATSNLQPKKTTPVNSNKVPIQRNYSSKSNSSVSPSSSNRKLTNLKPLLANNSPSSSSTTTTSAIITTNLSGKPKKNKLSQKVASKSKSKLLANEPEIDLTTTSTKKTTQAAVKLGNKLLLPSLKSQSDVPNNNNNNATGNINLIDLQKFSESNIMSMFDAESFTNSIIFTTNTAANATGTVQPIIITNEMLNANQIANVISVQTPIKETTQTPVIQSPIPVIQPPHPEIISPKQSETKDISNVNSNQKERSKSPEIMSMPSLEDFFGIDLNANTTQSTNNESPPSKQNSKTKTKTTNKKSTQSTDSIATKTIKDILKSPNNKNKSDLLTKANITPTSTSPPKLKVIKSKVDSSYTSPPLVDKTSTSCSPIKKKLLPKPSPPQIIMPNTLLVISPSKENSLDKKSPLKLNKKCTNKQLKEKSIKNQMKENNENKTQMNEKDHNLTKVVDEVAHVMPEKIKFQFSDLDKVLDQVESTIEKHKQNQSNSTSSSDQFLFDLLNIENTSPNHNNATGSNSLGDSNENDETNILKLNQFTISKTSSSSAKKLNKLLSESVKSHLKFNKQVLSTPPPLLSSKQQSRFKKTFLDDDEESVLNEVNDDEDFNGFVSQTFRDKEDSNDFFSFLDNSSKKESVVTTSLNEQRTPLKPDNHPNKKRGRPPKPPTSKNDGESEAKEESDVVVNNSDNNISSENIELEKKNNLTTATTPPANKKQRGRPSKKQQTSQLKSDIENNNLSNSKTLHEQEEENSILNEALVEKTFQELINPNIEEVKIENNFENKTSSSTKSSSKIDNIETATTASSEVDFENFVYDIAINNDEQEIHIKNKSTELIEANYQDQDYHTQDEELTIASLTSTTIAKRKRVRGSNGLNNINKTEAKREIENELEHQEENEEEITTITSIKNESNLKFKRRRNNMNKSFEDGDASEKNDDDNFELTKTNSSDLVKDSESLEGKSDSDKKIETITSILSEKQNRKRGRGRPPKQNNKEINLNEPIPKESSKSNGKKGNASSNTNGSSANIEYAGLTRFEIPIPFDLNSDNLLDSKSLNECSMSSFDRFNINGDECSTNKIQKLEEEQELNKDENYNNDLNQETKVINDHGDEFGSATKSPSKDLEMLNDQTDVDMIELNNLTHQNQENNLENLNEEPSLRHHNKHEDEINSKQLNNDVDDDGGGEEEENKIREASNLNMFSSISNDFNIDANTGGDTNVITKKSQEERFNENVYNSYEDISQSKDEDEDELENREDDINECNPSSFLNNNDNYTLINKDHFNTNPNNENSLFETTNIISNEKLNKSDMQIKLNHNEASCNEHKDSFHDDDNNSNNLLHSNDNTVFWNNHGTNSNNNNIAGSNHLSHYDLENDPLLNSDLQKLHNNTDSLNNINSQLNHHHIQHQQNYLVKSSSNMMPITPPATVSSVSSSSTTCVNNGHSLPGSAAGSLSINPSSTSSNSSSIQMISPVSMTDSSSSNNIRSSSVDTLHYGNNNTNNKSSTYFPPANLTPNQYHYNTTEPKGLNSYQNSSQSSYLNTNYNLNMPPTVPLATTTPPSSSNPPISLNRSNNSSPQLMYNSNATMSRSHSVNSGMTGVGAPLSSTPPISQISHQQQLNNSQSPQHLRHPSTPNPQTPIHNNYSSSNQFNSVVNTTPPLIKPQKPLSASNSSSNIKIQPFDPFGSYGAANSQQQHSNYNQYSGTAKAANIQPHHLHSVESLTASNFGSHHQSSTNINNNGIHSTGSGSIPLVHSRSDNSLLFNQQHQSSLSNQNQYQSYGASSTSHENQNSLHSSSMYLPQAMGNSRQSLNSNQFENNSLPSYANYEINDLNSASNKKSKPSTKADSNVTKTSKKTSITKQKKSSKQTNSSVSPAPLVNSNSMVSFSSINPASKYNDQALMAHSHALAMNTLYSNMNKTNDILFNQPLMNSAASSSLNSSMNLWHNSNNDQQELANSTKSKHGHNYTQNYSGLPYNHLITPNLPLNGTSSHSQQQNDHQSRHFQHQTYQMQSGDIPISNNGNSGSSSSSYLKASSSQMNNQQAINNLRATSSFGNSQMASTSTNQRNSSNHLSNTSNLQFGSNTVGSNLSTQKQSLNSNYSSNGSIAHLQATSGVVAAAAALASSQQQQSSMHSMPYQNSIAASAYHPNQFNTLNSHANSNSYLHSSHNTHVHTTHQALAHHLNQTPVTAAATAAAAIFSHHHPVNQVAAMTSMLANPFTAPFNWHPTI